MLKEKRKHQRLSLTVAATLTVNQKIIRASMCKNISQGGMYITTRENLNKTDKGTVSLTQKCANEFIDFIADFQVVWTNPETNGFGLQFTNIDQLNLRSLEYIINFQEQTFHQQ